MRLLQRLGRVATLLLLFGLAAAFALWFGTGGLWKGLDVAQAVAAKDRKKQRYDLTKLTAVNRTLKKIVEKYVEPERVNPRQMFLSALALIQTEVAQVIVLHEEKSPTVKVQVDVAPPQEFRVDNVQGPWDVAARLREVFVYLQANLKDSGVDLAEVEYAACNGILRTLDPHSNFMSPEAFEDMNMSTSGHFGGLGIVIALRDDLLTVMRPMPGTPAARSGLRRLDRITNINNESTLNMPLDDAVSRLRGEPGTKVTIWVHRDGKDGWNGSKPIELTREVIQIKSVESRLLARGIGYVQLKQFQSNTMDELDVALRTLQAKEKLSGLVLDLRNDPGGLLDQAARVSDRFLAQGTIVATVGNSEGRDEKRATLAGTEPNYPIVVLVNGQSASASEIVAGALKNNDRAIVVGETTFGKGSVQLVFQNITPEKAALKLTIAQYLTPGDVSIQGVGVTPDIELDSMTVDDLEMDLFASESALRERDLSKSLDSKAKRNRDRPFFKLRYNVPEKERAELRELGGQVEDEFRKDFYIRFAQELVTHLKPGKRQEQLEQSKPILAQFEKSEMASIAQDLKKLGVDWQGPPKAGIDGPRAGDYEVKLETSPKNATVRGGESMTLKVSVKNKSDKPIYQLRAITKSDAFYYDEKELVFGKLAPGETREALAPLGFCDIEGRKAGSSEPLPLDARRVCRLPKDAVTRQDVVKVRFSAEGGEPPANVEFRPTVESLPRPIFAYAYQLVDNRPGNGDGQLSRGEGASLYVTVKNAGKGTSLGTKAAIRNLTGDGLLLKAGRFDLGPLKPDESREVAFTFDVLGQLDADEAKVELIIEDRDLRVFSNEKVSIPVMASPLAVEGKSGFVKARVEAEVRGEPVPGVRAVGVLKAGAVVARVGSLGAFTKVNLGGARFGFVETARLAESAGPERLIFETQFTRSPPLLEVKSAALASRDGTIKIEGRATDADGVLDAYIFVGSNKVFYASNRQGKDRSSMSFSLNAALEPGVNIINVIARESEDTATRYTMVVRRDGPKGEALPTPKNEAFGAGWEFDGK
ncbi:MAG: MXAN_5808 family serine peptidase [Polyangiaceae bacterium]|nr:MXAN_5808 family serine peptidase [Polyangiaceae bacterium]